MNPFSGDPGNPNDPNNQMMLMSLEQVNEQNLIFFLMQNPDLVENQDNDKFKKSTIGLARNLTLSLALGTFCNLQLKRIPNFLNWPKIVRLPIRLPVFILPALLFKSSFDDQVIQLMSMHQKYYKRISYTKRTADLKYLDPQGILAQQFKKKFNP